MAVGPAGASLKFGVKVTAELQLVLDVFHGRCYQQAYSINVTRSDGELLFVMYEG